MPMAPRELVERLESGASLPAGCEERFHGYGVMGLPFASGHILVMRRFAASSVGPPYTSVWHRAPGGAWTFYGDVPPRQACPRFFGRVVSSTIEAKIHITWTAPYRFGVTIPAAPLEWTVGTGSTPATRLMNAAAQRLPDQAWRRPAVLAVLERVAGPLLGVGRVRLHGTVPNGQAFLTNPRFLWSIVASHARLRGEDLGPPGPVQPQARLGDFWIPQRGMFAIGQAYFDPFDPQRHSASTSERID